MTFPCDCTEGNYIDPQGFSKRQSLRLSGDRKITCSQQCLSQLVIPIPAGYLHPQVDVIRGAGSFDTVPVCEKDIPRRRTNYEKGNVD
jgi:hypothetical protein